MPTLRLAIVMGGGVSLGSFSGGALAGALRSLHRQAMSDGMALEIDILSGASAGGMSLGLLLRNLALPEPEYQGADFWAARVEAPMRAAWVEGVGLEALTRSGRDGPGSLLSPEALDTLAGELMAWPDGTLPQRSHPEQGVRLGPRVYFLATLMNLNGIPVVSQRLAQNPALVDAQAATLYRDHQIFCLEFSEDPDQIPHPPWSRSVYRDREALSRAGTWEELSALCLACGSFPIAFEPRVLQRSAREFGTLWPWRGPDGDTPHFLRDALWLDALDDFPFTYGDGGAFNNEPLKEAMALIRTVDDAGGADKAPGTDRARDDRRALLFIDPHLSGTAHTEFLDLHHATRIRGDREEPPTLSQKLLAQAGPTASAVMGQAGFRDVREADRVNQRLEWRGELRALLEALVRDLPAERQAPLLDRSTELLRDILDTKQEAAMRAGANDPTAELRRIRDEERSAAGGQAAEEARVEDRAAEGRAASDRASGDRTGDDRPPEVRAADDRTAENLAADGDLDAETRLRSTLFAVLDQVAGLRDRRQVEMVAVGPLWESDDGHAPLTIPMAGGFFRRFGGFLRESFREHDFRWGVRKGARARLPDRPDDADVRPPLPDPPPWPDAEEWQAAGRALRKAARSRYMEVIRELDAELGVRKRDFLRLGFGGVFMGFRGSMEWLFDNKLGRGLERMVSEARVPGHEGLIRLRVRVEDGLGPDGPGYQLEPSATGPLSDPARNWTTRHDDGAHLDTWVTVRVDLAPGADVPARRTLTAKRGPHLSFARHARSGAAGPSGADPTQPPGAGDAGDPRTEHLGGADADAAGAAALRIVRSSDGAIAASLPLSIPLGPGSAFAELLLGRLRALESGQEPLLQVTVDLTDPGAPTLSWRAVPIGGPRSPGV